LEEDFQLQRPSVSTVPSKQPAQTWAFKLGSSAGHANSSQAIKLSQPVRAKNAEKRDAFITPLLLKSHLQYKPLV
jgi:hypothetical protein